MQVNSGTVIIANGSAVVRAALTSMDWSQVVAGAYFSVYRENATYQIASDAVKVPVGDDLFWQISLTAPYAGATPLLPVAYQINQDATPNYGLSLLQNGNNNAPATLSRNFAEIDRLFAVAIEHTLFDVTPDIGLASILFSDIAQDYTSLRLEISARTTAANAASLLLQYNGDVTPADYITQGLEAAGAAVTAARDTALAGLFIGYASGADTTRFAETTARLPFYTLVDRNKATKADSLYYAASGTALRQSSGFWLSNLAVSSLTLKLSSGTFVSGTRIRVIGVP